MEVLIEGLIEVFGEIFLEIIAALIGTFFDYLNENSKVKKYVKSIVAFVFYGASIVLFISSSFGVYPLSTNPLFLDIFFVTNSTLDTLSIADKDNVQGSNVVSILSYKGCLVFCILPQHFLYFIPLPHGHGSFLLILFDMIVLS